MRIKTFVSSSGDFWHPKFPVLKPLSEYFPKDGEDGSERFDYDKAIADMRSEEFFSYGGNDTKLVVCTAVILIDAVNFWMKDHGSSSEKVDTMRSRLKRKENTDRVSRVDIEIRPATIPAQVKNKDGSVTNVRLQTVRFGLRTNDCGVVEQKRWEMVFGGIVAERAMKLSERYIKSGSPRIIFDDSVKPCVEALEKITEETEEKHEIHRLNGNRPFCPNRAGDYCSPPNRECRCCGPMFKCCEIGKDGKLILPA